MNKIYKIVWSKAKHAYVVTSEVARSHTKSASGKAVKAALAAAVGMGVLMGGYAADAADTATGSGSGVAYGTGSSAPKEENVAVGQGASIGYSNGASAATGDIAELNPEVLQQFNIGKAVDLTSIPAFTKQLEEFIDDLVQNTDVYQRNLDAANKAYSQENLIQNILR